VRRIWVGPNLIYDAGSSDPDTLAASNAAASGFQLYLGTDTQAADARMQATLGVANTPAWRGLAYLVFYDLALERYANSLAGAQVKVELVEQGVVGGLSFLSRHHGGKQGWAWSVKPISFLSRHHGGKLELRQCRFVVGFLSRHHGGKREM
jgi:hypothetical protein